MTTATSQHLIARGRPRETLATESCPRCHGTMMLDFDFKAGYYRSCINCGHIKYIHRPALNLKQR